jgi:hypothetical protein
VDRSKIDNSFAVEQFRIDVVVSEIPAGVPQRPATLRDGRTRLAQPPAEPAATIDDQLVLYVVSLFGVTNIQDELVSGDALLVRPRGTPAMTLLSSILECPVERLPDLLARSGSWSIRELNEIDGHRVRFEP